MGESQKRKWTNIITALMFPVLIFVFYRLSKRGKSEMITLFGEEYRRYTKKTPMFIPGLGGKHNGKDYIEC